MALKATCPTSPDHKRFLTTGHVMEEWMVDETGQFVERKGLLEVTHEADPGNIWGCVECGAEATVVST